MYFYYHFWPLNNSNLHTNPSNITAMQKLFSLVSLGYLSFNYVMYTNPYPFIYPKPERPCAVNRQPSNGLKFNRHLSKNPVTGILFEFNISLSHLLGLTSFFAIITA